MTGNLRTVRRLDLGKAMSSHRKEELKAYSNKMWRIEVGDGTTVRGSLAFKSMMNRMLLNVRRKYIVMRR